VDETSAKKTVLSKQNSAFLHTLKEHCSAACHAPSGHYITQGFLPLEDWLLNSTLVVEPLHPAGMQPGHAHLAPFALLVEQ
jgi:hypothetical protein